MTASQFLISSIFGKIFVNGSNQPMPKLVVNHSLYTLECHFFTITDSIENLSCRFFLQMLKSAIWWGYSVLLCLLGVNLANMFSRKKQILFFECGNQNQHFDDEIECFCLFHYFLFLFFCIFKEMCVF